MTEAILPGTYITVRDEGLISAGSIASGVIGIVGTAAKGEVDKVYALGSISEVQEIFGDSDSWQDGSQNELTLVRALELIYNNGGQQVYAVRTRNPDEIASATHTLVESGKNALTLTAKGDPGSWGNAIQIEVADADEQSEDNSENSGKSKQITLTLNKTQEIYIFKSKSFQEFAEEVNQKSNFVEAENSIAASSDKLPENTSEKTFFQGGNDGASASASDYAKSLQRKN